LAPGKKEIIQMMEQLDKGQSLSFKLPETFGGNYAVIEINPDHPQKGQKKYVLRLGKSEDAARKAAPFWLSDKAKQVAGWVSDRLGELISRPPSWKGAA
jgi:hypothetical protein